MHFVGASLLGTGALHPVGPDVSVLDTERSAGSVCSMRSTVSSLATTTDPDSLSTRVAKLEVWTADISTQIDAIGPSVAEQIDTLRKALADEHSERQLAHKTLLKSIEALGLEDVVASVSSIVKQKLASDLSSMSAELGAKVEVLKVQLESRVHDTEARLQNQGRLDELPRIVQGLQEQLDAIQMKLLAADKKSLEQSVTLVTLQQNVESSMKSASDCAKAIEQQTKTASDVNTKTVVDRVGIMMHEKLDAARAQWQAALEEERTSSVERTRVKLDEMRSDWQKALEEERSATTERTRTLGRTLAEEFEKNTVAQAVAESRTEACTVACDILSKELETWDQTRCSRSELSQVTERISVAEDRLKEMEKTSFSATPVRNGVDSSVGSIDKTSLENISIISATVSGLDHRLGALCKDLQSVQASLQTEVAQVRTDMRKQSAVDVHALQATVQKLLLQSESVRRELESSEKVHREALEREARERTQADEKVERTCLEQLRDCRASIKSWEVEANSHVALLRDMLPLLGNREQHHQQSGAGNDASSSKLDLRLQGRLQSLLAKLNRPGFEDLGPDLRQLSSMLGSDGKRGSGDSLELTSGSGRPLSLEHVPTRHQSQPPCSPRGSLHAPISLRVASEDSRKLLECKKVGEKATGSSLVSAGSSSDQGDAPGRIWDAPGGLTLDALKEDIMVYLKSEFQDQISERLRNMQPPLDSSPPPAQQPVGPTSPRDPLRPRGNASQEDRPTPGNSANVPVRSPQIMSRQKMPGEGSPLQSSLQPSVKPAAPKAVPKAGHSLVGGRVGLGMPKAGSHARSMSPTAPSMLGGQAAGSGVYPVSGMRGSDGKFVLRPRN